MTCQNQAGYGIFSEDHSWDMINLKIWEVYMLKLLQKTIIFKRDTLNLRINGRKV